MRWSQEGYINVTDARKNELRQLEPFEDFELDISVLLGDEPKES